jgi:hypothetical protein
MGYPSRGGRKRQPLERVTERLLTTARSPTFSAVDRGRSPRAASRQAPWPTRLQRPALSGRVSTRSQPIELGQKWRRRRRAEAKTPVRIRARGRSSVGRALASQARCRGFESHRPLHEKAPQTWGFRPSPWSHLAGRGSRSQSDGRRSDRPDACRGHGGPRSEQMVSTISSRVTSKLPWYSCAQRVTDPSATRSKRDRGRSRSGCSQSRQEVRLLDGGKRECHLATQNSPKISASATSTITTMAFVTAPPSRSLTKRDAKQQRNLCTLAPSARQLSGGEPRREG